MYSGGMYRTAALLSPDVAVQMAAIGHFKELWVAYRYLTELAANSPDDKELKTILKLYIWGYSTLYLEFLTLSLEADWDFTVMCQFIIPKIKLVQSCMSNEKGMEDVFKSWRQVAKSSANGLVARDRLYFSQRAATPKTFPNVAQLKA